MPHLTWALWNKLRSSARATALSHYDISPTSIFLPLSYAQPEPAHAKSYWISPVEACHLDFSNTQTKLISSQRNKCLSFLHQLVASVASMTIDLHHWLILLWGRNSLESASVPPPGKRKTGCVKKSSKIFICSICTILASSLNSKMSNCLQTRFDSSPLQCLKCFLSRPHGWAHMPPSLPLLQLTSTAAICSAALFPPVSSYHPSQCWQFQNNVSANLIISFLFTILLGH